MSEVHKYVKSVSSSEPSRAWRRYVCDTCMSDFFRYTIEATNEAVINFEGMEFLVTLFSQAVLGIMKLAEEEEEGGLLENLRKLDVPKTVDLLLREDQEPFSVFELNSLKMMLTHTMQKTREKA